MQYNANAHDVLLILLGIAGTDATQCIVSGLRHVAQLTITSIVQNCHELLHCGNHLTVKDGSGQLTKSQLLRAKS